MAIQADFEHAMRETQRFLSGLEDAVVRYAKLKTGPTMFNSKAGEDLAIASKAQDVIKQPLQKTESALSLGRPSRSQPQDKAPEVDTANSPGMRK